MAASQYRAAGWLYAATIVTVGIAPSLGGLGTALRFGFALMAFLWCVHAYAGRKVTPMTGAQQMTGILLLLALGVAALLSPIGLAYGISRLINWILFGSLVALFNRRPNVRALAVGCLLSAGIQSVGVLLQMQGRLGGTWGGGLISGTTYNRATSRWLTRYTGFVLDPNNLAIIMSLGAVAAVAVLAATKSPLMKVTMLGGLAGCVAVLVSTGSRGGLLALPLGLFVYATYVGARAIVRLAIAAAVGAYLFVSVQWSSLSLLLGSLEEALGGRDASLIQRFGVWQSYELDGFGYLTGTSFGGYNTSALSGSGWDVSREAARAATVDNAWLKLYLETGLLGVAVLFSVVLVAIASLHRARSNGSDRVVGAALAAALVILLWRSISTDVFDVNPYNALLPLLLGACYWVGSLRPPVDELGGAKVEPARAGVGGIRAQTR